MSRCCSTCVTVITAALALLPLRISLPSEKFILSEWPAAAPRPDFHLIDATARRRSLSDYAGRTAIVFFGFTHCPDICPTELSKLSQVMRKLGPAASKVQVLFITLDPQRDAKEMLGDYVTSINPQFVGLTGSTREINEAAERFSVQFAKTPAGKSYTIDHSTGTYAIDRTGHLRLVGTPQTGVDDWVHDLRILMGEPETAAPNDRKD